MVFAQSNAWMKILQCINWAEWIIPSSNKPELGVIWFPQMFPYTIYSSFIWIPLSLRSFLQSRLRAPHDRHPSSTQQWRGSSMCWIRGSLYRVSANKLSRTVAANMSINRTGICVVCSTTSEVQRGLTIHTTTVEIYNVPEWACLSVFLSQADVKYIFLIKIYLKET